ncbi:MAG: phosphotransferase family protein, partial [Gaiellaceae bacterium]
WVADAGALLGRLHASALAADVPSTCSTRTWCDDANADLEILCNAGKLTAAEAAALRAEILRRDPETAGAALVHTDFCAENMLIDTRGCLRVIDNERLSIEPPGYDLGRTFDRWPMSAAAWQRFRGGYRSSAPAEPQSIGFWKIVVALVGARIRFKYTPARLGASLVLLRRLAAGGDFVDA